MPELTIKSWRVRRSGDAMTIEGVDAKTEKPVKRGVTEVRSTILAGLAGQATTRQGETVGLA